ncbi:hypothetical protein CCANI_06445 [Corynebacterium canis]|nr:hypothetical protein CCANI_06445 [Corynebacterium canis]
MPHMKFFTQISRSGVKNIKFGREISQARKKLHQKRDFDVKNITWHNLTIKWRATN